MLINFEAKDRAAHHIVVIYPHWEWSNKDIRRSYQDMPKDRSNYRKEHVRPVDHEFVELNNGDFIIIIYVAGLTPDKKRTNPKNGEVTVHIPKTERNSIQAEVELHDDKKKVTKCWNYHVKELPSKVKPLRENEEGDYVEKSDWKTEKDRIVITLKKEDPTISWKTVMHDTGKFDQYSSSEDSSD